MGTIRKAKALPKFVYCPTETSRKNTGREPIATNKTYGIRKAPLVWENLRNICKNLLMYSKKHKKLIKF